MKKLAISTIASSLLLFSASSSISYAATPTESPNKTSSHQQQNEIENLSENQQNVIKSVQKYVELKNDGTIGFVTNIPQDVYKKYKLNELQKHFDSLNSQVASNMIAINPDLSIQNKIHSAVYGEWTYHWWGYDRKFNNSQAKAYVKELNTVARTGAVAGPLAAAVMPIVGAGIAVTAGYYGLLADRVENNNQGSGVYVGITWAIVFDVEPL
ncbi:hypothetical protein COL39_24525 [Bacillus cereus]|uniref:hypothetical protein n=1 Tax=Bacillus cereus TaxID=1396 RepID=UPI000BFA9CB8|nr:hypothetical protein [Bacillus cereus]PFX70716.1 hypothetical protein COL39_24525 [Bacillus cereus]